MMCGRFNVTSDPLSRLLMELVGLAHPGPDNFNTAPTEMVPVLRVDAAGVPSITAMRWWLTPYWSKAPGTKYSMFNAKSETAALSPAFREPFRKRRCVVPISGFYEWAKQTGGAKQPYYMTNHEADGMLLAGLWDRWHKRETTEVIESFTILTAVAHEALAFVHNRQPVMLSMDDARQWLDPNRSTDELEYLFAPRIPCAMNVAAVSNHVNNARNKDQRVFHPVADTLYLDEQFEC